jgi:hypothetical protein
MRRIVAGLAWVGLTAWAGVASAQDVPPPLTPPLAGPAVEAPIGEPDTIAKPPERPPTATPAPKPASPAQVLAVPGVTAPRAGSRRPSSAPTSVVPRESLPPLLAPDGSPTSTLAPAPGRGSTGRTVARPPATLESVTADPSALDRDADTPPLDVRTRREGVFGPRDSVAPPARRAPGFFSRILPPINRAEPAGEYLRVDPRSDPATDATLKRRIEKQIRDNYGSQLRSYEVRVAGRQVVVRARAARFWTRRSLRTGIEQLPALQGYRAVVDVVD